MRTTYHIERHPDIFIHEHKDVYMSDCILVVGFPSVGLISSIAANYIVRTLKLERVASIISDQFPPYTIMQEGVPSHAVRIYSGKRECRDGESCEQLVVILAEFMPKPELLRPLAELILEWGEHKGVRNIVTLEGINLNEQSGAVLGVGTTPGTRAMLEKYDVKEMREGMITGLSGMLLAEGNRLGSNVICLLGPARPEMPDARGAANLMEIIGKMLPELKIDPEPLLKEAESIEVGMRQAMESIKPPKKADESYLYG